MDSSDFALLPALDALLQEVSVTEAAKRLGLSTPAMSHTLARLRERFDDPLLVRSGRGMVLTPRAEALRESVRAIVAEAERALEPERPFVPQELERTFVVTASDYVLTLLGPTVDRILTVEAPRMSIRFTPNTADDAHALRARESDLAVGIYGELPQEMRTRPLLTDRFVCVLRRGHSASESVSTLDGYLSLAHIQVAPRGKPGGYIDDVLRERGVTRRVARAVPYFLTALHWVAQTDYVLTVSERIARQFAGPLQFIIVEPPIPLRAYALSLVWHPLFDADAGHAFLRDVFLRAAREVADDRHERPRTKLDKSDPTSGEGRRRPRRMS